jgi:molybdate/tungstate transport system substrate-binding protein
MKHLPFSQLFLVFIFFLLSGCNTSNRDNQLLIFHAGSLTVPVKQVIDEFNRAYPDVTILSEAAGSVASARKITDLNRQCDVFLSADYNVINNFLIPDHADWNIPFAANEMVVAYHGKSKRSDEINSGNWFEILLDEEVRYGRSDPNSDPCGYRTLLSLELAESYYGKPGMLEQFKQKDTRFIRPKETDLIALLQTNTIDYFFIYRSVAVQHDLPFLLLPDSINLKSSALTDWYTNATVEINGKHPGNKIPIAGEPMIYGLTIPKNAPNRDLALQFVKFLLSENKGMAIMEKNGQPSLVPSVVENYDLVPEVLHPFVIAGR